MYFQYQDIGLYYEIHGDGPPIVFLSGFGGGISLWYPIMHKLKQEYKIILYDHRGTGKSLPAGNQDYSMRSFASDLMLLLNSLGIKRALIAGYSMGGWIAQNFAVEYPEMAEALFLVNTSYKIFSMQDKIIRYYQKVLKYENEEALAEILLLSYYSPVYFEENAALLERLILQSAKTFRSQSKETWIKILDACLAHNIEAYLEKLAIPVFIVSGEHDFLCPRFVVGKYKEKNPLIQWMEMKEIGHAIPMERHKELGQLLQGFIKKFYPGIK